MEYKRFGEKIVARIDKGEELLEALQRIAEKEKIKLAQIQAIGATNDFTVGIFDTAKKQYNFYDFKGDYEIISLLGSINTMNNEYYSHLHISVGSDKGAVFGGHLTRAVVSLTCEMFITVIDGMVDRERREDLGINIYKFN